MPAGRASMQMTLTSQGRSASALTGALSGSGTVTLESARIAGLDPRAFEVAIRASDNGQANDDAMLKQIVEPALAAGALAIASAQIPFTIRDGRLRVGATTLDAKASGPSSPAATIFPPTRPTSAPRSCSTMVGPATSRPEIQLFAEGTPDALNRTVDVAALSSWLAVRAIDRETRRLDAIERGEPPPPMPAPIVLPPPVELPASSPEANPPSEPLTQVPLPGRDRRRSPAKPKAVAPRVPAVPSVATAPPAAPGTSQQHVAPLPPPIDVKPAPRRDEAETAAAAGADAAGRQPAAAGRAALQNRI